jgi:protein SDA1
MLKDPNETASKRSLSVMIELYKRKMWNDDKTVNVLAEACLHDNPKVCAAACKFFLVLDYDYESDSDDGSSDDEDKKMLLKQYKGTKKLTKARETKMDRALKQHKRKERRKNKVKITTDFLPIDLVYDP